MGENNTKRHNIFCLDKNKVLALMDSQESEEITNTEIVEFLIVKHKDEKRKNYNVQELKEGKDTITIGTGENATTFELFFFFNSEHQYNNKLKSFCKSFVKPEQEIFNAQSKIISSVLFVASTQNIFIVTTGQGFRVVEDFCVQRFGMKYLSVLLSKIKITRTDANKVAGAEHSTRIIYNQDVNFVDVNTLDTIYKEITGKTKNTALIKELLSLSDTSNKKTLNITAKNFLQLGSSMTIDKLLRLLAQIDAVDISALGDEFNSILSLSDKNDKEQILKNNTEIARKLYQAKLSGAFPFDIFHNDIEEFIEADKYIIWYNNKKTEANEYSNEELYEALFSAYDNHIAGKVDNESAFLDFVAKARIISSKDDLPNTEGKLLEHISGEIAVDGKNYYVFYGKYYFINTSYETRLDALLGQKLRTVNQAYTFTTDWNTDEDAFNADVSNSEDYAHLHKIKIENIEFADLIKFDDGGCTIVHAKDGFDGSMRILERQIELSMIKLNDLRRNNQNEFFKEIYNKSQQSTTGKSLAEYFDSEDAFITKLQNKDYPVIFVMAIRSDTDFTSSRSNIAKHCLMSLINKAFQHGFELKIAKIREA